MEIRRNINKTCPVDPAGHFDVSYVPSPRLCAIWRDREAPYEARKTVNNRVLLFFSEYLFRVSNFSVATRLLGTDIGGFGGQAPLISARLDPCTQGIVDGTPGSPRPTKRKA